MAGMRHALAILVSCGIALGAYGAASALPTNGTEVQKSTYMLALRCYVANEVAISDRRYNAAGSSTAAIREKAAKAKNVIYNVGNAVSYPKELIDEDVEHFGRMLPKDFKEDDPYYQRTRAQCAKYGLI